MIDNATIQGCIKRERRSLQMCYDRCSPYIYAVIKSYITEQHDIKEVMQSTFIEVFNSLKSFDPNKGALKSWLSTIAYRQCVKFLKKEKRLVVAFDANQHEVIDDSLADQLNRCTKADIQSLVSNMPVGYRTVFLLHTIDGASHKEIAAELGITVEASRSQLSRSIKWIRKNLLTQSKDLIYGKY